VTAPLTDRLIAHSVLAPINQATADLLQEAALELARLESQLEAVRLAKPADGKHGCHCDLENMPDGYQPDDCVMDYGDHDSCVYARILNGQGKGKEACEYWQPIKTPTRGATRVR
jgi:hypothetical protein